MKKSFILYYDQYEPIKNLSLEQKGKLLDMLFLYNIKKDENEIKSDDSFVNLAFSFFRSALDRDYEKYNQRVEKNTKNALKRWNTNACDRIQNMQTHAKHADNGNDNDIGECNRIVIDENDNEKKYSDKQKEFVEYFTEKIRKEHPKKAPHGKNVIENQLKEIEMLVRIDGFDEQEIFDAINWALKDDFWQNQIFSLSSLRNKSKNGLIKFQNIYNSFDKERKIKFVQIGKNITEQKDIYNGY